MPEGSRVAVAFSGGADSLCLLHLMWRLGLDPVALHLDHGQRQESAEQAKQLGAFCDSLGVPFASGRADVPALAKARKIGLEEAGREARYSFFREAASRVGCDLVATGHTADDLSETVLFNLIRGTGMAGLGGIPASRDGIVRPLLPFTRAETRAYCAGQGLTPLEDPGNENLSFSRVRLRLRVMPELELAHPGAAASVARTARLVGEENNFLDGMAAAVLEKCEVPLNGPLRFLTMDREVAFDQEWFNTHPLVLRRRAVRLAASALGASTDHSFTEQAVQMIADGGSQSMTTASAPVRLTWDGRVIKFERTDADEPFRYHLVTPGVTESDIFGWQITARPWNPGDVLRDDDNLDVVVDTGSVEGQLYFRSAHHTMKMTPLGMSGSKPVTQIMAQAKLTDLARARLPVVCDMVGPVWVPGCRLAERVKIADTTVRALRLTFGPLDFGGRQEVQERIGGS